MSCFCLGRRCLGPSRPFQMNAVLLVQLLVLGGKALIILLLFSNNWSLTPEHLHSSLRLVSGSSRTPFPYRPMLLRHCGTPSHFFAYDVMVRSIFSTVVIGTLGLTLYHLPRLLTCSSATAGIGSSPMQNKTSLSFSLTTEMLRDLFGLIFIEAHSMFSCSFPSSRLVQAAVIVSVAMSWKVEDGGHFWFAQRLPPILRS